MSAVFEGGHVGVEGLPVVAHQGHSAGGGKSARDALAMQDTGGRVPTERFGLLRLGHALEQSYAAAVGIKAVDVVEDEGLMPMFVGLEIDTQWSGLAADPADLAAQGLADTATFANTWRPKDHQQVQMSGGESAD